MQYVTLYDRLKIIANHLISRSSALNARQFVGTIKVAAITLMNIPDIWDILVSYV